MTISVAEAACGCLSATSVREDCHLFMLSIGIGSYSVGSAENINVMAVAGRLTDETADHIGGVSSDDGVTRH